MHHLGFEASPAYYWCYSAMPLFDGSPPIASLTPLSRRHRHRTSWFEIRLRVVLNSFAGSCLCCLSYMLPMRTPYLYWPWSYLYSFTSFCSFRAAIGSLWFDVFDLTFSGLIPEIDCVFLLHFKNGPTRSRLEPNSLLALICIANHSSALEYILPSEYWLRFLTHSLLPHLTGPEIFTGWVPFGVFASSYLMTDFLRLPARIFSLAILGFAFPRAPWRLFASKCVP